jgi:hypothetical protein
MKVVCSLGTTGNADPVTKCHIPEDLNPHVVNYKDISHHSKIVILCMFFARCAQHTHTGLVWSECMLQIGNLRNQF